MRSFNISVRLFILPLAAFFIFSLMSCDEERRTIIPFVPEGNRVILLEEFTGKGCTNCPKGSREIENLLTLFPDNLVAVSIHAGFFANPQFFPIGQYDLRTEEGEDLFDFLGPNLGYPAGVINRIPVNGEMQLSANAWSSAIAAQLQTPPAIELTVSKDYDPSSRSLTVQVTGIGKSTVANEIRVSIMLTESGIVDAQDDIEAGGIVQNYVHKHVLRDMITPSRGAPVLPSIATGETFSVSYSTTLDTSWVAENMEIIAFVSEAGANFPVIQAAGVHLVD